MTEIDLVYQTRLENPEKLIHNVKNAATHSEGQIALLANAFKKFGFIGSVIVGRDNVILAGHGRVLAALKAGMPEIPVTDVSHLTDDEQAAYMIAENKLAELKGWDQEVLDQEITRLTALDFDLGDLGFIDDLVTEFNGPGPREHSEEPGKHSPDEQWETDDDEDGESREERYEAAERDDDIDEKPEPVDAPIPFEVPARVTGGSAWRLGKHILVCGNSSDASTVHKFISEESAHSIVTDPPYGISFMGKEWDHGVPSSELWKVWFSRVTPGAHILSFCATRMYHHMAMNIENAGFSPRDMISWMYGSGMPKSLNISKAIDKAAGIEREVVGMMGKAGMATAAENYESNEKWSGKILGPAISHSAKQWDGWGTALKPANEPIMLARKPHSEPTIAKNVQRYGTGGVNIDGSRVGNADTRNNKVGGGGVTFHGQVEKPRVSGSANGRWPSNVILSHADGCVEVGVKKVKGISGGLRKSEMENNPETFQTGMDQLSRPKHCDEDGTETVEDWQCVEDCPVRILDEQSGILAGRGNVNPSSHIDNGMFGNGITRDNLGIGKTNEGGASRFFKTFPEGPRFYYVAKPSRGEKNSGLEAFDATVAAIGDDRPSGQSMQRLDGREAGEMQNDHATVKPIRLMQYLIKLITPPGGTVLEPFAGSGTTLLAAEQLHMKCIAFELDPHHCDIILARWEGMTGRKAEAYTTGV